MHITTETTCKQLEDSSERWQKICQLSQIWPLYGGGSPFNIVQVYNAIVGNVANNGQVCFMVILYFYGFSPMWWSTLIDQVLKLLD